MYTLTDLFCGCGGSSEGASNVPGVDVRLAMNHWPLAVESHNANHQNTDHDCADISNTDPRRYRPTNILIGSPECTKHSPGSGKRRKNLGQANFFEPKMIDPSVERSRATMWDIPRFAEVHRYDCIIVENVVEVMLWELFTIWLKSMHKLGYLHQFVFLNSQFAHGEDITGFAPQSRDRIYIVFHKKGNPKPDLNIRPKARCFKCGPVEAVQTWKKNRKAGKYGKHGQYLYRCPGCLVEVRPFYYAAINAIDFSIPMERIADRKVPLKPNTRERIEKGLAKHGLKHLLLNQRYGSGDRVKPADGEVFDTMTSWKGDYLFSPFVLDMAFNFRKKTGELADNTKNVFQEVLATQTGAETQALAAPPGFILDMAYTKTSGDRTKSLTDPIPTTTTSGNLGILMSEGFMPLLRGGSVTQELSAPLGSITAGGIHHGLAFTPAAIYNMRKPHEFTGIGDPIITQTASGIKNYLVSAEPFIHIYNGNSETSPVTDALPTVPTKDRFAYAEARGGLTVDECYFRMLRPSETARAQGFPSDYIILGKQDEQQKQIGNANPPPTMELLVRRCVASLEKGGPNR